MITPVRSMISRHSVSLLLGASFFTAPPVRAVDVAFYGVLKNQAFAQTTTAPPTQSGMFTFRSFVRSTVPNVINSASLRLPNGSPAPAAYVSDSSGQETDLVQDFPQKTQLDSVYPSGNYVVIMSTKTDGTHQVQLVLPTDAYPLAPHINNFAAAQAVDATAGFTLTWDALSNGTANDFAQLIIKDGAGNRLFQSPPPGQAGSLNGTSTSLVIPANTLSAGQTYTGELLFLKVAAVNSTAYPGATGFTGFAETTTFSMVTTAIATSPADVTQIIVLKGQQFVQTGVGAPSLSTADPPFIFNAFADLTAPNSATGGSVQLPNGTVKTLVLDVNELRAKDGFTSQAALDTAYPSGNYTVTLNTAHGVKTIGLGLSGDTYPATPHLSNFTAAQAIDSTASFTLTWDAFAGASASDFVEVRIEDSSSTILRSPNSPAAPGALNGLATSFTIPANVLAPGQTYHGTLFIAKGVTLDTNSYPGALGVAAYVKATTFALATKPTTAATADVQFYVIQKRTSYAQTGAGAPTLDGTTPYRFDADVVATGPSLVNSASVRLPSGASQALSGQTGGAELQFKQNFSTTSALNTAYPIGNYVFTLSTVHDGTRTPTLVMTTDNYPAGPHIGNFTAAQAVNAAADFTLTWDAFPGGTANDLISVRVADSATGQVLFRTPLPGTMGTLDGTATSLVIPANTLTANHSYQAKIEFDKVVSFDTTSYPGAVGVVLFTATTSSGLVTAGGVVGGPDVSDFHVAKGQLFTQTGTSAPTPQGATPYVFSAEARLSSSNAATGGSVRLPNGTTKVFTVQSDELRLPGEAYASQASLDAADPNGNYTLTLNTVHDGTKTITLSLSGNTYPTAPHVSNFSAAQAINANATFTLSWDAFAGGGVTDFISLSVDDPTSGTVFSSGEPASPGALNGTATSAVIPANRLQAGHTYQARLLFVKVTAFDPTTYPGSLGLAGYFVETGFTLATSGGVSGPDVQRFGVVKGQQFAQSDGSIPIPRTDAPFVFRSFLDASAAGAVASASLQLPNGSSLSLGSGGAFDLLNGIGFTNQAALDAAFPNGTYHLNLVTAHDGNKNLPLTLPAANYPNTPHVRNFAAAQAINAAADFTLTWDPFTGGTTSDFVQVNVQDSVGHTAFKSPSPGAPGALDGTAVSIVIPGNTLVPGATYFVTLLFARGTFDTTSYPGAIGIAGYFTSADLTIATKGATSPTLSNPLLLTNRAFQLHLSGDPNQSYQIEASGDFAGWTILGSVTTGPGGSADFTDNQASSFDHRFYRAAVGAATAPRTSLSFNFYANAGNYGVNGTPQSVFPVPLNSYRAILGVNNDSALPAATNVTFSGPAGSGLTNTPADFQNNEGNGSATYGSPDVQNPTAAPPGAWTVNYKGAPLTFTVQDPQAGAHLVIAVPTITVVNGVLQQLNWIYKAANGSTLSAPPSFMTSLQVQISGQNYARVYDSPNLAPATTSLTLPISPSINWSSVTSIAMAYEDTLGDSFVVFFYH